VCSCFEVCWSFGVAGLGDIRVAVVLQPAARINLITSDIKLVSYSSAVSEVYLTKNASVQVSFPRLLITRIKLILRSSLFWDVTQCRLVVSLPTFRDNLSVPSLRIRQSLLLDPWRWNSFTPRRKTAFTHKLMLSNIEREEDIWFDLASCCRVGDCQIIRLISAPSFTFFRSRFDYVGCCNLKNGRTL